MPGTIVNPKKDLNCIILITFLLTSLQILFNIMDEFKSALDHNNRTFLYKYFFHWVTIVPILPSKANKQLTFIILFTNKHFSFHFLGLETLSVIYGLSKSDNKSLDGTPLGQPSGRDAPSFSKVLKDTVSDKNAIY